MRQGMGYKKVVILGSTGSIGVNALKVIAKFPDQFKVVGLTAYSNVKLLEKQIKEFFPTHVAVTEKGGRYLKANVLSRKIKILNVDHDLDQLVTLRDVDIVLIAMRGSAALKPFLSAVQAGKTVAPAKKDALVVAGNFLMEEAKRCGARVIPIDSEQSAIFQCLEGRDKDDLKKVILTASGGALLNVAKSQFPRLSVKQILNHPRWKMGKKITVDSATLMNKGFEFIEAMVLFQLNAKQIKVVVHPEAIIHSMAEFKDGAIVAQLSVTDMRLPIQYALTYPQRWDSGLRGLDFARLGRLTFENPDLEKFPSLALAISAGRRGGTLPCVLNAANEEAVEAFLNQRISFPRIYEVVEKIVNRHKRIKKPNLETLLAIDCWAREEAKRFTIGN